MDLRLFIKNAIDAFPDGIRTEAVAVAASDLGLSLSQFCDAFAKEVDDGFLAGRYSWSDGDVAMNALWGYISRSLMKDTPIPDYAFGVFLAFDAGETIHEKGSVARTTELLNALHEKA